MSTVTKLADHPDFQARSIERALGEKGIGRGELRLRQVSFVGDFRRSEVSNMEEALKRRPMKLRKGDCILIVNSRGTQAYFIEAKATIEDRRRVQRSAIISHKCRLLSGHFDPGMIAAYARMVGIDIGDPTKFTRAYDRGMVLEFITRACGDGRRKKRRK